MCKKEYTHNRKKKRACVRCINFGGHNSGTIRSGSWPLLAIQYKFCQHFVYNISVFVFVLPLWCAKGVVFVNPDVNCHIQIKTRTAVWMGCLFATLWMFGRWRKVSWLGARVNTALEGHFCHFQGTTAFGRCSVPGISGHGRCRFRCDMHAIFNALEIIWTTIGLHVA